MILILPTWRWKLPIGSFALLTIAFLIHAPAAAAQGAAFNVPSNQPFEGRGGRILGTVYLGRGVRPASRVVVHIQSLSSGVSESLLTDSAGHFELRDLPPGSYEVSVEGEGHVYASAVTQVSFFPSEVSLYLRSSDNPPPDGSQSIVTVRELKIPSKAQDEYDRGLKLMGKKDFAGSLVHFNKATAAYPDYYEAFYHIGLAELGLDHRDQAMEAFQKAIDLSGGHYAGPQFAYGLMLCNEGKAKEGEYVIRRGLEADANAAQGHLFLAISLLSQNRLDEAEKSLREALLRRPQYPDVYLVFADIHAKRGNYQEQVQDLDTYLKLVPAVPGSDYVREVRAAAQRHLSESAAQK